MVLRINLAKYGGTRDTAEMAATRHKNPLGWQLVMKTRELAPSGDVQCDDVC